MRLSMIFRLEKIEVNPPDFLQTRRVDYLLCTPGHWARGTVDPFTGRLYADLVAARARIIDASILLKSWRLPDQGVRPVFCQPDLELRYPNIAGVGQHVPGSFNGLLDAPFVVNRGRYVHVAEADGHAVGPQGVLHVSGRTSDIRFRGRHRGVWHGVAFVPQARADGVPGDADVVWRTRGVTPRRARVPYQGSRSFVIEPDAGFTHFPKERIRVVGDESRAVCLLALFVDPVPAARLLRRTGSPAEALAVLATQDTDIWSAGAQVEAFLATRALGGEVDPVWTAAARRAAAADPISAVMGVPVDVLRDFARIRLSALALTVHASDATDDDAASVFEGDLPILLMPGRYAVAFRFRIPLEDRRLAFGLSRADLGFVFRVDCADITSEVRQFTVVNGLSDVVVVDWDAHQPVLPRISVTLDRGLLKPGGTLNAVIIEQVELVWDPLEQAEASRAEIRAALDRE